MQPRPGLDTCPHQGGKHSDTRPGVQRGHPLPGVQGAEPTWSKRALTLLRTATWSDDLPIACTVRIPSDALQPYVITEDGSPADGYVLFAPEAGSVLDGGGLAAANVVVNSS